MAVVQELIAKLGFRVDQAGLQKADNGLQSMATSAAKMFAAYQLAAKSFGLVASSVKAAANLEAMNAEFEVMLGNAEAAKYIVQQIQQFAAVTPFETAGLVGNIRLMMAFGQSANEAMAAIKTLGDVAGSDQERLNRLTLAYAQVMAAGRLQGQDLLQFVNAGFNPLQELSRKTGKSMAQLRKEMEKGNISAAMVTQAFQQATGPGGRFFGNMEKQSRTLNGLWSTLRDNFRMMMADLGGRMVPFIKAVIEAFIPLMEDIAGAYRQLGDFFALMFAGGPTAGDIAAYIAAGFETIADAIMLVGSAMQLFKYLFIRAANEIAAEAWDLIDTITYIPRKFLEGLLAVQEGAFKFQGWVKGGNTREDTRKFAENRAQIESAYETLGGKEGFEGYSRSTGEAENQAEWDKFMALRAMVGQTKAPDASARVELTDKILAALEGMKPVSNYHVTTNNTIHAEGSMKDILTEQANSVFGTVLGLQLRAATV